MRVVRIRFRLHDLAADVMKRGPFLSPNKF
jgi:hypothetical protein